MPIFKIGDSIQATKEIKSSLQLIHSCMSNALSMLTCLNIKLLDNVPHLFVILPVERKGLSSHPSSWLHSQFQEKHSLCFVCSHSMQAVSLPLAIRNGREWVCKAAPLIGLSLILLKMAGAVITCLPVGGALKGASELIRLIQVPELNKMHQEICEYLKQANKEGCDIVRGIDRADGTPFSTSTVHVLHTKSRKCIASIAMEQSGWDQYMMPVSNPNGAIWVLRDVAKQENLKEISNDASASAMPDGVMEKRSDVKIKERSDGIMKEISEDVVEKKKSKKKKSKKRRNPILSKVACCPDTPMMDAIVR